MMPVDSLLTSTEGMQNLQGSFWSETYDGRAQAKSICSAVAEVAKQLAVTADELQLSVSRSEIQPYRRERWRALQLKQSELNTSRGSLLRFGDGAVFGAQPDGSRYQFGVSSQLFYTFPVPAELKAFQFLSTRISSPGRVWVPGVEVLFDPDRQLLIFRDNPLDDLLVAVEDFSDNETVSERIATLWLSDSLWEHHDVYEQHGFAFGFPPLQDSGVQQPGLAAVADNIVGGTTLEKFQLLLAASTGIELTGAGEIVEAVLTDRAGTVLVTDQKARRLPADVTISAVVGDTLETATFVTDDVLVQTFSQGTAPDWLTALALPRGFLAAGFGEDFMLQNADVELVTEEVDGQTRLSFDIGGDPENAAAFFQEVHTRALAAGTPLSDLIEEWAGGSLPETINPLEFCLENLLRNALLVVRLKLPALRNPGRAHLRRLAELVPPHLLLILLVDLRPPPLTLILAQTVTMGTFTGMPVQTATATVGTIQTNLRIITTNCE